MPGVRLPLSIDQKDPEDPEELRQGFTIFTADWNQSFAGPLKNAALSAVGVPVYEHVNTQFGKLNHMNFASKLYLLLYDTDIDFRFLQAQAAPPDSVLTFQET